ncbi:hypothetical protein HNP38_002246 [Chryseobacterium defluvii]|uniref:Glycine zipper domain-containing protein n=1 Tax=Chryseobacterium defluvii TaxID=160396 RepID=A0A840KHH4_9FLAO|nr:hypothetical protein [Chryseobacterium defluvii]MBB4806950.1 hypothetical protein [Chryseobacterium defluvii]
MKKIVFFTLFSISLYAQKNEFIELKESIKDKKALTKSLTVIDNRASGEIGTISDKGQPVEVKFADENIKSYVEKWFSKDNKEKGNNDIVLMLEELKAYDEKDPGQEYAFSKIGIKISSFIKRNDRYYFINRFDNVIVSDPKRTVQAPRYLAQTISDILTEFIKASYTNSVSSQYIPEKDINNYNAYLSKNYDALMTSELKDGVYMSFKNFLSQEPAFGYRTEKNRKGEVVRVKYKTEQIPLDDVYCYVEAGKAYRLTPVGFLEMEKDDKGFYIVAARTDLFAENQGGGMMVGAIAGGALGAIIGAAIDSGNNKGAIAGFGFRSRTLSNVYIDSITGGYIFEK